LKKKHAKKHARSAAVASLLLFTSFPAEASLLSDLGAGTIRFYQTYVSSQDGENCSMRPSCSQFGLEAIRRRGFFQGVLLTADRLARDNPWTKDRYPLVGNEGKYYLLDPVEGHQWDPRKDRDIQASLLAGGLSLLVPGGGQLYRGHGGDALSFLLLSGCFDVAGAYYLQRNNRNWGVGYLLLGGLFQAGSVYGALFDGSFEKKNLPPCESSQELENQELMNLEKAAGSGNPLDRLRLGDYFFLRKEYPAALEEYRELPGESATRMAWCLIEMGNYREAAPLLAGYSEEVLSLDKVPRKSEETARTMSIFLPGSGQAYAGRWGSGFNAALLNLGFFGLTAYTVSQRDPIGLLLTLGFGSRFYSGNIENASRFTRESNYDAKEKQLQALRNKAMFEPILPQSFTTPKWP
jgi:putative component of membrane protein insertase Oxa1/YidC/SpoIIIJ protein YidD/TM2 domain-containing membrane protein YozV